jgi:cellulose synthase operon protein C
MIAELDTGRLPEAERRDLAALQIQADIRASDHLNERGDQAAAFERLRPALLSEPNNPDVQVALARLYQGAKRPADAMRVAEAVLTRDPRNADARQVAVEAAIAAGDRRHAETLADEGAALSPGDSRAILLEARVARAFGDISRARTLLAEAAAQRQAELGLTPQITNPAGAASPPNPFSASGQAAPTAALPADPVARQIAEEQAALWADTATQASGAITLRGRSGTPGLDRLADISAPLVASVAPDAIDGRITARVTPVLLDNGTLSGTENILHFGSNAEADNQNRHRRRSGPLLSARQPPYSRYRRLAARLPRVNDRGWHRDCAKTDRPDHTAVARGTAHHNGQPAFLCRRARSGDGITWGGVTRSGGHAQLEAGIGNGGYVYGGGGYNIVTGQNVAENNEVEGGAGFGYPLYKEGASTLLSGLDLVYFAYANNQRGFTVGQGGYFSPQNFAQIAVPLDFHSTWGKLTYHLRGDLGYMTFREDASPLYPLDPALQAAADAAALLNPDVPTHDLAQVKAGVVGGIRVDMRYPQTDALAIAGGLAFDQAPQWEETSVYVRMESQF